MNKQKAESFLVRMTYPKSGSGIIYLPSNNPELVFLFTARHCIEDAEISNIEFEFQGTEIQCTDDGKQTILKFKGSKNDNDLAILVLPRTLFLEGSLDLVQYEFLDQLFDLKEGIAVGYPNAHDDVKKLKTEFRQDKPESPACFEVSTAPKEDLTSLHSDGYDNTGGMSGGGFFIETKNCIYLAGVLIQFSANYKDFTCIRISKINELLQANDYAPISCSFANKLGLNQQWFGNHIARSIEDLGDRYNPELNFELPIAKAFDGLTRGEMFQKWIEKGFHDFLKVLGQNGGYLDNSKCLKPSESLLEQYNWCRTFFIETNWKVSEGLKLASLKSKLDEIQTTVSNAQSEIWNLQLEQREEKSKEGVEYYTPVHSTELGKIREISNAVRNFNTILYGDILSLAINPCLLIHGEAGSGKSHLLGDIAKQKQEEGKSAVLILGNKLKSTDNVWRQIIVELGLDCTANELLRTLNSIGEHIGERILFMVDALNEGDGKVFWQDNLAGFLQDFRTYPFIGLVIAVRDTYLDIIVPDTLLHSDNLVKIQHQGFRGKELEVIKHFCNNFGLEQPHFPILSPEFSNPKLLLLLCRSLRDSGKKTFPRGANGITQIYKDYLVAVNRKIASVLDYSAKEKLVQAGLEQ